MGLESISSAQVLTIEEPRSALVSGVVSIEAEIVTSAEPHRVSYTVDGKVVCADTSPTLVSGSGDQSVHRSTCLWDTAG